MGKSIELIKESIRKRSKQIYDLEVENKKDYDMAANLCTEFHIGQKVLFKGKGEKWFRNGVVKSYKFSPSEGMSYFIQPWDKGWKKRLSTGFAPAIRPQLGAEIKPYA